MDFAEKHPEKFYVDSETGCWIWTACRNKGYGAVRHLGRMTPAHRVSWIYAFGEIPKASGSHGMCVCHKCDNTLCVNPEHLFLGTHQDNMDDMVAKGRDKKVNGEAIGIAKLTEEDIPYILADNRSMDEIALDYGVSQSAISKVKRRVTWKHIQ